MSVRPLLEVIKKAEAPEGYDQLNFYMERAVGKHPLSKMNVKAVLDLQKLALARGTKSTAVGQYQILRKTLLGLCVNLDLKAEEMFDAAMQDRLAEVLMEGRGLREFLLGGMTREQFANSLAKEWAGLPVVSSVRGAGGWMLPRGASYYSGDKLNAATVSPEEVLAALSQITEPAALPPLGKIWSKEMKESISKAITTFLSATLALFVALNIDVPSWFNEETIAWLATIIASILGGGVLGWLTWLIPNKKEP